MAVYNSDSNIIHEKIINFTPKFSCCIVKYSIEWDAFVNIKMFFLRYVWVRLFTDSPKSKGVSYVIQMNFRNNYFEECIINELRSGNDLPFNNLVHIIALNKYYDSFYNTLAHITVLLIKSFYWSFEMMYSRQQNYSSNCDNIWNLSLIWLPIFIISCLL